MSQSLIPSAPRRMKNLSNHGIFSARGIMRLFRITFISGPFLLFTSRLSVKTASMMMILCAPALLLTAVLTVPALLFTSPEQNAYFQFAGAINADPTRLIILALTAVCTVVALAVPATAPNKFTAIRS